MKKRTKMPFVKIYLSEKYSDVEKRCISTGIHESLQSVFDIPHDDLFQVINTVSPSDLIYPESYLDIPHTESIIYINIICAYGRTVEMKKELYAAIAEKISDQTSVSIDDVFILISETSVENWSFGGGKAQKIPE